MLLFNILMPRLKELLKASAYDLEAGSEFLDLFWELEETCIARGYRMGKATRSFKDAMPHSIQSGIVRQRFRRSINKLARWELTQEGLL